MSSHALGARRVATLALRSFSSSVLVRKKTLPQLAKEVNLSGKPVLVRADLNLPRSKKDGTITDDTRARAVRILSRAEYMYRMMQSVWAATSSHNLQTRNQSTLRTCTS